MCLTKFHTGTIFFQYRGGSLSLTLDSCKIRQFRKEPVFPVTCQDNILGLTRKYLEKRTAMYASFYVRTNQIYIVVSIEVLHYSGTYPRTIFSPRVVLSNKIYWDVVTGDIPRGVSQVKKTSLITENWKITTTKIIAPPSGIISLSHYLSIGEYIKVTGHNIR